MLSFVFAHHEFHFQRENRASESDMEDGEDTHITVEKGVKKKKLFGKKKQPKQGISKI